MLFGIIIDLGDVRANAHEYFQIENEADAENEFMKLLKEDWKMLYQETGQITATWPDYFVDKFLEQKAELIEADIPQFPARSRNLWLFANQPEKWIDYMFPNFSAYIDALQMDPEIVEVWWGKIDTNNIFHRMIFDLDRE